MMNQGITITEVSPALRFVVWLCDNAGMELGDAMTYVESITVVDESGLRQFPPEWMPHLPPEIFAPPIQPGQMDA